MNTRVKQIIDNLSDSETCGCENPAAHFQTKPYDDIKVLVDTILRYEIALERIADPYSNLSCLHNAIIIAHEALEGN